MSTTLLFVAAAILAATLTFVVAGRDTPNAVALPIASGALTPVTALSMTALMRMVGAVLGVGTVQFFAADFVALVPAGNPGLSITIVGLAVTVAWAIFTWFRGATVSTSHALTASMTGGAVALSVLNTHHLGLTELSGVSIGIGISLLASPLLAAAAAWLIALPVTFLFKNTAPHRVGYGSRGALAIAAAANGLGHGVQYGQRIYIVMLMALAAAGFKPASMWPIAGGIVLALGVGTIVTAWRVNYTLTRRISLLDPMHSAVASSTSALLLLIGSFILHIPLSSSLTTVAAITGAGTAQNSGAVRWIQVMRLMVYFVSTILICATVAFIVISLGIGVLGSVH